MDSPLPAPFPLQVIEPLGSNLNTNAQTLKGTPYWMSPEVIQGSGYGRKADVWSVGCVVVEMVTGKPPWSTELGDKAHPYAIMYHIVNATAAPALPPALPEGLRHLADRMFQRVPANRPTASEILEDEWLCQSSTAAPGNT